MKRAAVKFSIALSAGLSILLASCKTTENERSVPAGSIIEADGAPLTAAEAGSLGAPTRVGLPKVAGSWKFSGLGNPTINTDELSAADDPVKLMSDMMKGATLTVGPDGRCSLTGSAPTETFRLRVAQETEVAIQLSADGAGVPGKHFLYEKPNDRLVMPGEIQTDTKTGVIPIYFRRAQ